MAGLKKFVSNILVLTLVFQIFGPFMSQAFADGTDASLVSVTIKSEVV